MTENTSDIETHYKRLQWLRIILFCSVCALFHWLLELRTSLSLLLALTALGVHYGGKSAKATTPLVKVLLRFGLAIGGLYVALAIVNHLLLHAAGDPPQLDFLIPKISVHITALVTGFTIAFALTRLFWLHGWAATGEAAIGAVGLISLLHGHRNYNLDAPKQFSDIAWQAGVEPQHLLLGVSGVVTAVLFFYLRLSFSRPIFGRAIATKDFGQRSLTRNATAAVMSLAVLFAVAFVINHLYATELSRAMNGVGTEKTSEGQSPLGFHSATGKTKQPAALVRLEGDYEANPWNPMLYIREGALSAFNGKELVVAGAGYDVDVPKLQQGRAYMAVPEEESRYRKSLTQSVYLLAKHNALFAVDYPTVVQPIKNPDAERFLVTYQAISQAPVIPLEQLIGENVGDTEWSEEQRAHYLRAPGSRTVEPVDESVADKVVVVPDTFGEDLRYKAFAEQITKEAHTPIQKAIAISRYLSVKSIYTRKPGHTVTKSGDPVAPYLFSDDMRGYCVHFAHAAVYLMRLVGIPARIGTGYLTDLTYAKDGHILLHLGDRHAWPEIYVENYGWIVVDVSPEQAENEPELIPDEKLLEELMSKITPAETLLAPELSLPDEEKTSSNILEVLRKPVLLPFVALLAGLFLLAKIWLRWGYLLKSDAAKVAKSGSRAILSRLIDLGYHRQRGETRREYEKRLMSSKSISTYLVTESIEKINYAGEAPSLTQADVSGIVSEIRKGTSIWRNVIAFFSPKSLFARYY